MAQLYIKEEAITSPERTTGSGEMVLVSGFSTSLPERCNPAFAQTSRSLSLAKSVVAMGGLDKWNSQPHLLAMMKILEGASNSTTVEGAFEEISAIMKMGYNLWAYAGLRMLCAKDMELYYGMLTANAGKLLPVAYTPTVGEACQKFGHMPQYQRGCYVSLRDKGNVWAVLQEYAEEMLQKGPDGKFLCQCIVFSDGGRILGLGDLGAWGMGIPLGKLDLYTVCAGFNPYQTIPVMIDVGILGKNGNTAKIDISNDALYTGMRQDRVKHKSDAGTDVNTCYYGKDSFIREFMTAARDMFGPACLLQFEDFNSNDAMPLLAEYRDEFLTYNDDIQGTAGVVIAAMLGAIKIQKPSCTTLLQELRKMKVLFHGAGSSNLGGASLIINEGMMPQSQVFVTNSKGVIWKSPDGSKGSFKNNEQKALAQVGQPSYGQDLVEIIRNIKPDVLIGAVGVSPNCFTKEVIQEMLGVQDAKPENEKMRPIVFALSNPITQAEITAHDAYAFSNGQVIFGSGTRFEAEMVDGKVREPGQVNNFFIFPGMSFGAHICQARSIPERLFMVSAEAVANCLDAHDIEMESVVPNPERIREVAMAVAVAVVLESQKLDLAGKCLGNDAMSVRKALEAERWSPHAVHRGQTSKL